MSRFEFVMRGKQHIRVPTIVEGPFVDLVTADSAVISWKLDKPAPCALRVGDRAVYDDAEVLASNPHFASLRPVFETGLPRPRSPVYPQVSNALQRFLHRAISSYDSDVPGLARDAAAEIERSLELGR